MNFEISLFSWMFFIACITYFYWGMYLIRMNPKEIINKTFLYLTIALSIWSFGYGMSNSVLDLENALLWTRLASAGMMFSFSLTLHFIFLLTCPKNNIDKKWSLKLIYIPTLLLVFVFSISSDMALLQYNLIITEDGWTSIAINNNMWGRMSYVYVISYTLIVVVFIKRWAKRLEDKIITKQANLILFSICAAFVIGFFVDIVIGITLEKPIFQISPLVALIPTGAMYHAARYHGVLVTKIAQKEESIVSSMDEKRIFYKIVIVFLMGGSLVSISRYYTGADSLKDALEIGIPLIVMGIILAGIQRINKDSIRENATTIFLVASIPLITLLFLEHSALTAWVFPIIIIVSSLLFSNRILLYATTIVAVGTQIMVWIIMPNVVVAINGADYITRIGVICLVFLIGLYINEIYISKVNENKSQLGFQKVVSDITFGLVSLNNENLEEKVNELLLELGVFLGADRTCFFTMNYQNETIKYSNEWCNATLNKGLISKREIPIDAFSWWIEKLENEKLVYINEIDEIPPEASLEKQILLRQGVKSVVSVPVLVEDKMQAFIVIDSVSQNKKWTQENIKHLSIISSILAGGLSQIKADREVEFLAYYDNLTTLPNRFLFSDRVNQAIELSKRTTSFVCVMFIDLDNFKSVNDTIGHKGGDKLLKKVADSLVRVLRKNDTVARFGGDEFMIMLSNISDIDFVTKIADKIMKIFSEPFVVNDQEFLVTASGGIAISPVDGEDSDTLVKNADLAMYKAKGKGKNQYAFCTDNMKSEVKQNMELSNDLYRALERNELEVYYQPQIDLVSKKISGVEALLRWKHPTKGMISPMVFIPIAEKNSLINSIGDWVLKESCLQNKRWQDKGLPPINIAVNLSGIQMMNPKLSENVERIITETGLDPKYIELEITESIAIKGTSYVTDILNKLKKIGLSIAIDDFGTGYSSLSILKMLPVDRIKIDMQFIRGLDTNKEDKAITMVIINLAKSLGLGVLAEGVETGLQLDFLNQKMCDNVQGYYFYKPMPADEMEKILFDLAKEEEVDPDQNLKLNMNNTILKQKRNAQNSYNYV